MLAALGDFVWHDLDADGIQDTGEPPVAGVTVTLLDSTGAAIRTTVTDSNGAYLFDGLNAGTYAVRFSAPAGYTFTSTNSGTDDALDSDASPSNGTTATVTLAAGETNRTVDAGLIRPVDLAVTKDIAPGARVRPGSTLNFTINVRNVGNVAELGPITVVDTLPTGLTFQAASGDGWTCTNSGQLVTCTRPGPLAGGAAAPTITVSATVAADATGSMTNKVEVRGTGQDTNPKDNTATVAVPPDRLDLAIVKRITTAAPAVGSDVVYTLTASNVGATAETGPIVVTDHLPSQLVLLTAGGTGWTCTTTASGATSAATTIECSTPGPLPAGADLPAITIKARVSAAGTIDNVATIRGARPVGEEIRSDNNISHATFALEPVGTQTTSLLAPTPAPVPTPVVQQPSTTGIEAVPMAAWGAALVAIGVMLLIGWRRHKEIERPIL